jgi:uncharacterized protein YyaL (SSP411 family)
MNKLHNEKSPYLLQHKDNPVDWYPWGEEAFEKARSENKPIFLSIGYSTCHWCHVMAHESFENNETAAIMNAHYVNIKIDREERPDIDKVYMTAVQTMSGHGGWPLSVFLTPDLKPFYGSTYFPPKDAYGRPGFPTVLERIHEVWQNERENILQSAEQLMNELRHRHPVQTAGAEIDPALLKRTYHQIAAGYDPKFGGFGSAPKFPRPVMLQFLFRYHYRTKDEEALRMGLTTLMAMANGGMADHLGGGFHRYSVDAQWRVPHFEKMLYDQAQLAQAYMDAYQITQDETFAVVARETLDYVLRDMTSPGGSFFSAEDADSADPDDETHSAEGAYYTWKRFDIDRLLTKEESAVACHYFGVEENGNVLSDPHNEFTGKNILFTPLTIEQTAAQCSIAPSTAAVLLANAKKKLFDARLARRRPHLDDKILTSWNGLMIGAFSRASALFGKSEYAAAAIRAADHISTVLYDQENRTLRRRFRDGEAKYDAHLDDYAFLVSGLLDLYQSTQEIRWLTWANDLTGTMVSLFWDSAEGGFFDTTGRDRSVLVRMKESYDGAEPAGNSVAVMNLLRLHRITMNESYHAYAKKSLLYFCTLLDQSPQFMPALMSAVDYFLVAPEQLVIARGNDDTAETLLRACRNMFLPDLTVILLNDEEPNSLLTKGGYLQHMTARNKTTTLYYCNNFACHAPTTDVHEIVTHILRQK